MYMPTVLIYLPFEAFIDWIYTFLNHLGDDFLKRHEILSKNLNAVKHAAVCLQVM